MHAAFLTQLTRRSFATGLLLTIVTPAIASQKDLERRFRRLGGNLICCCGCGDGLLSCNHVGCQDDARMIRELREQLIIESKDVRILQWFAAKYGATVLAAPLRGGFDDVAWIVPPMLELSSLVGVGVMYSRWRKRAAVGLTRTASAAASDELLLRIRQETSF